MKLPTASSIERAMNCPASCLLPHVDRLTSYSDDGTWKHRFLHAVRRAGREAALRAVPERLRGACAAIDVTALPMDGEPEITYAWNWHTGKARRLGEALDRNYERATPDEYVGTSDNARVVGNRAIVDDYKSGWKEVPPDSWQMKANALMVARANGCTEAETIIWRIKEDGSVYPTSALWSDFDLDLIADELVGLARRLEAASKPEDLKICEGQHCTYCPATLYCPAKRQAVTALASLAPYESPGLVPVEKLGEAWAQMKTAQAFLERVEIALRDCARATPLPLPDGRVLKEVLKQRDSINPEMVHKTIADLCGADVAAKIVEKKVTKKRITEVLGKDARKVFDALRERGAITVEEDLRVEEAAS
jgi:hypothetical protein